MKQLPPSWCSVQLSEIVELNPGIDKSNFGGQEELPFVPMSAVEAGTGRIDTRERRSFSKVKSGFTPFASGDVLFAKITPCMENGKMAVVPPLPDGVGFGTTEFYVLRPTEAVDAKLVYYFVSSAAVRHEAQRQMTGAVGQKRVPKRYLQTKRFPLPPFNEQLRIVEKIETLFSRLDMGEGLLREVQKLLGTYHEVVLRAAATGELTTEWRAKNAHRLVHGRELLAHILRSRRETWQGNAKYKEPRTLKRSDLPELPRGWVWVTVDQLLRTNLANGRSVPDATEGFPVLRLTALKDGRIDLSQRKIGAWDAAAAEPFLIKQGDILVSRGNGSRHLVGRGGLVVNVPDPVAYPDTMIRLRVLLEHVSPVWFLHLWNSPLMRSQIEKVAKTTAGIYKINQTDIRTFHVPLPPREEQEEIEALVNEHVAKIAHLASACKAELARSVTLRESILKEAFSGRLVPQDPSDEPASVLLARNKENRAAVHGWMRRRSTEKSLIQENK